MCSSSGLRNGDGSLSPSALFGVSLACRRVGLSSVFVDFSD